MCYLSVHTSQSWERILTTFSGNVANRTMKRWLHFGDVWDYHLVPGISQGFFATARWRSARSTRLSALVPICLCRYFKVKMAQKEVEMSSERTVDFCCWQPVDFFFSWLTVSCLISTFWLTQTTVSMLEWCNRLLRIIYWSHVYKLPQKSSSMYDLVHQAHFFPS